MAVSRLLRHLLIDLGLFLFVGIFLAVNAGWTPSRILSQLSNVCTDSDGFANIRVWGRAQGEGGTLDDYCKDSKTNMEAYCTVSGPAYTQIPCPSMCVRGVCNISSFSSRSYSWSSVSFSEISSSQSSSQSSSSRSFASLPPMSFCTDSDAGLNYDTVGNVTEEISGDRYVTWDQCRNAQTLAEAYCDSTGTTATRDYVCPQGCEAGKCRRFSSFSSIRVSSISSVLTCIDTDGGDDIFTRGSARGSNGTQIDDICTGDRTINEAYCAASIPTVITRTCPGECLDGRCIPTSSSSVSSSPFCTDTDGGLDYYERGWVTWRGETQSDFCVDSKTVLERYCTEAGSLMLIARCSEVCVDGRCTSIVSSIASSSVSSGPMVVCGISPNACIVSNDAVAVTSGDNHCYIYYNGVMTWPSAKACCEQKGGYLTTITRSGEQTVVAGLRKYGWIGIEDQSVEGGYQLITGGITSYRPWASQEPDNSTWHSPEGEDCVETYFNGAGEGLWNDYPCDNPAHQYGIGHVPGFICEFDNIR